MQDVYFDTVLGAELIDGVATVTVGVTTSKGKEPTLRLRIPLMAFQYFTGNIRKTMLQFMKQGYYGEEGKKALEAIETKETNETGGNQ